MKGNSKLRGGSVEQQLKLTDINEIKYMARALPILYFKINTENVIIDLVIGNGYFGDYYFYNCIGTDYFEICPSQFRSQLEEAFNDARQCDKTVYKNFYLTHNNKTLYNEYKILPAAEDLIVFVWSEEIKKSVDFTSMSQLKHNGLFDLVPDLIAVIDYESGHIVEGNEALVSYFELAGANLSDINVTELIFPEYLDLLRNIKDGLSNGEVIRGLVVETRTFLTKKKMSMEILCSGVKTGGKLTHVFCVVKDLEQKTKITQMKEMFIENLRLLNEAVEIEKIRTEFFSNISHEFKTPINVLLGALKLMEMHVDKIEDKQLNTKLGGLHNSMKLNCYRLLRLVSNFLDITRIETGYIKINMMNCDIIRLVEEIVQSINIYAIEKGINLIFDCDMEERIIGCDPEKIERIVLNLLSNAIKFTSRGDKVFVHMGSEGGFVTISVKDTGIGIRKENQEQIFERFKQVNKSFSRNTEGTGIGLSLVKSLVEMHQGKISVNSIYGEGSEFLIHLPDVEVTEDNAYYTGLEGVNIGDRVVMEFSDVYIS